VNFQSIGGLDCATLEMPLEAMMKQVGINKWRLGSGKLRDPDGGGT
jgi:hypothetical protein